jgi:hypothetical protein
MQELNWEDDFNSEFIGQNLKDQNLLLELSPRLDHKIALHRDNFFRMFINRYLEILYNRVSYENIPHSIDTNQLEYMLVNNYNVVIGKNVFGNFMILGFVIQANIHNRFIYKYQRYKYNDIHFTIPEELRPLKKDTIEIWEHDNFTTGNFVVLKNKIWNSSDIHVIHHYAERLAEVVATRYSLMMQTKVTTAFKTKDFNDESNNQMIASFYNGSPFLQVMDMYDKKEDIFFNMENLTLSNSFDPLKREYENIISELNTYLAIDTLAVNKESGVSASEINANIANLSTHTSIYLQMRIKPLQNLQKRYPLQLKEPIVKIDGNEPFEYFNDNTHNINHNVNNGGGNNGKTDTNA